MKVYILDIPSLKKNMEKDCPSNNTRSKSKISDPKGKKKSKRLSDVDEDGNLMDFIVPDNYIEYDDGTVVTSKNTREAVDTNSKTEKVEKSGKKKKKKKHKHVIDLDLELDMDKKQSESMSEKRSHDPGENELKKMAGKILLSAILGGGLGKSKKRSTDDDLDESDSEYVSEDEYASEELEYTLEEEKYLKHLDPEQKKHIDKLEEELQNYKKSDVPYRFQILNSSLDMSTKSLIIERLDQFYMMDSGDNEYHKLNRWLEGIMKVPFGKYSKPMVSLNNNLDQVSQFLNTTKHHLDNAVYGHETVKTTILQSVAMMISNPKTRGKILALQGPPGNGKTTLIREGVAKAMGRPFAFIALGGATDSCMLEGHDFTYEGSQCGRIINILKECKTMDPVICFDELDKISETPKGEEIANLLCHLTDHSQNNQFHDKYYSGIDFDLSKATFIFSFNDISKVNPILLDRIKVIQTSGFKKADKVKIATDYLLKSICHDIGFPMEDLVITKEMVNHIIDNYTEEEGVRSLRRCLETIVEKINLLKITTYQSTPVVTDLVDITEPPVEVENTTKVEKKEGKKKKKVKNKKKVTFSDQSSKSSDSTTVKKKKKKVKFIKKDPAASNSSETVTMVIGKKRKTSEVDTSNNDTSLTVESDPVSLTKPDETDTKDSAEKSVKPVEAEKPEKPEKLVSYHIKDLKFPFTLDQKTIDLLLKENKKEVNPSMHMLYT